jgi:predicted Zn-dependent protease
MRKPCLFPAAALLLIAGFTPLLPGQNSAAQKNPLDDIGRRDINSGGPRTTMPIEDEIHLGRQLSREFELSITLDQDPATLALVERIGQIIARNSDVQIPITLRVIENEQPNVLSLPGGYVYVTKGLIRMSGSDAELAFALAHGIAHVAARHVVESRGALQSTSFLPWPVSIFSGGIVGQAVASTQITPASLLSVGFAKASAEEADFLGLQYLYKAGYDPQAAVTLLKQIEARSPIARRSSNTLQTHLSLSSERIRKMEGSQRFLPPRDRHILTTQEFDSVHGR